MKMLLRLLREHGKRRRPGNLLALLLAGVLIWTAACGDGAREGADGEEAPGTSSRLSSTDRASSGSARSPNSRKVPGTEGTLPSIFLIVIDTLRADRLPAYGYEGVSTPSLDQLAADSIVFENAYTPIPLTLPAHVSLFTGQLPYQHGVRDNVGFRLDVDPQRTLPSWLSSRGYRTEAAVSAYVLRGGTGLGPLFDAYDDGFALARSSGALGDVQRSGRETVEIAARRLELAVRDNRSTLVQPIFFFLHLFEPHTPYFPPEPHLSTYGETYEGEIAAADEFVGKFLETLQMLDLYEDSLIILTSDHGEGLGDHGEAEHGIFLYRETTRVPLFIKLPSAERGGERRGEPVHWTDLAPTIVSIIEGSGASGQEVAGADQEGAWHRELSGRSLIGDLPSSRRLYLESFYGQFHLGWSGLRSLVDKDFQFIEAPRPELYDLEEDPEQRLNVLRENRPAYFSMRDELSEKHGARDEVDGPSAIDEEDAAKLAALGYLTRPVRNQAEEYPDPKDVIDSLNRLQEAYQLSQGGRCLDAIPQLEELRREFVGMVDVRVELAGCYRSLGQGEEALNALAEAIELSPRTASLWLDAGEIYLVEGRLVEAGEHAAMAVETGSPAGWELQARVVLEKGDINGALEMAQRAVSEQNPVRAEAILLLARIEVQGGDLATARGRLDELRDTLRENRLAPVRWLEFLRGDVLARLGESVEAERAFRSEIETYPQSREAYTGLIYLLAAEGRFESIESILEAMVAAVPTADSYMLAADTAARLGDSQGAVRWRQRAAQLE
ncbi:MAG: sulfatase-like hydrolase/transferase [Acidobacteriota bacterium]